MAIADHATPPWFGERRYGMFVHANVATVPSFAPVHQYADWYWSHLSATRLPDSGMMPPPPLPEVAAFHAEHFPGFAFDDFIPLLHFDRFDADGLAELASDAGMGYLVFVTKHHDGFCWWDSALTDRTSARRGPKRDVTAELAGAARRAGLEFGTYYSLLDWAHPAYPDQDGYVDAYLRPQLAELVERFQPAVLWGDGHWGHPPDHWRSDMIVEEYYSAMADQGLDGAVNDRFFASHADFTTFEYEVPTDPPAGAWELCRGIGYSFCFNRAEEDDDHLSARELVALLTETVAKGGNLLLNVGPQVDGTVPDVQEQVLRHAGAWVEEHASAIHASHPFSTWGDDDTRYTVGADGTVFAIDLTGAPERVFAALRGVDEVVGASRWVERSDGLHVERDRSIDPGLAAVFRVRLRSAETAVVRERRGPGRVQLGATTHATLGAALAAAMPGDVVDVGCGRYGPETETFPLRVGNGVTLRGESGARIEGGGSTVIVLASDAALVRCEVHGGSPPFPPNLSMFSGSCVTASGADRATVEGCALEAVAVAGGTGHRIIDNQVDGGAISVHQCEQVSVVGNRQRDLRWGVGIEIAGGEHHVVAANDVADDLCGIRAERTVGARIEGNAVAARWWGTHVRDATATVVAGGRVARTMRAVCVEGGTGTLIEGTAAFRCDTGVLVEQGARGTRVVDADLDGCRVGVLVWDAPGTVLERNTIRNPRDHAVVRGPRLEVADGEGVG